MIESSRHSRGRESCRAGGGLPAAAEVRTEVAFKGAVEADLVLWVVETVAFVGGEYVLHGDATFSQRGDYVVPLGLDDPGVIGALGNQ